MKAGSARKYLADQDRAIKDLLGRYVKAYGCPCRSPRFEYWAGKSQGPGWQDNFQNGLITEALKLPTFQKRKPENPLYEQEAEVTCAACGREWKYFAEEWRMLAFRYLLKPVHPSPEAQHFAQHTAPVVGGNVFATAGHEPDEVRHLSLHEWLAFMSEGLPEEPPHKPSLLARLLALLRPLWRSQP